jgi:mRNA-degrading endonuclease HigB of HigAB toxin-antitoxin module
VNNYCLKKLKKLCSTNACSTNACLTKACATKDNLTFKVKSLVIAISGNKLRKMTLIDYKPVFS